jgi:leucyl aminopeptidase
MSPAPLLQAGGRAGGSITAALFLKEFIKEGVEWAHLDIAGPVSAAVFECLPLHSLVVSLHGAAQDSA